MYLTAFRWANFLNIGSSFKGVAPGLRPGKPLLRFFFERVLGARFGLDAARFGLDAARFGLELGLFYVGVRLFYVCIMMIFLFFEAFEDAFQQARALLFSTISLSI